MNSIRVSLALVSPFAVSAAASAQAGANLFVGQTGHVYATYLGTTAAYSNDLYLDSPSDGLGIIFNNQNSAVGAVVDLGSFTAGTELIFRLHVNNTGDDFYSGDASRNPDGSAHALVDFDYSPTATAVYFEDLYGGPYEYNDLGFSFTNLRATPTVPGPLAAAPFALGLLRRRRKA